MASFDLDKARAGLKAKLPAPPAAPPPDMDDDGDKGGDDADLGQKVIDAVNSGDGAAVVAAIRACC